jgi:RNA-binding protein NOB1
MVLSYSAAAKPAQSTTPATPVESIPDSTPSVAAEEPTPTPTQQPAASSSTASGSSTQHLILDAGPLVSLTPLRHLAQAFHTTPMVVAELRDPKSRAHWQQLGLMGVDVKVEMPKPDIMARGKSSTTQKITDVTDGQWSLSLRGPEIMPFSAKRI